MAMAGSPATRMRSGSAARVVFVGAMKKPNYVVESYKMPGSEMSLKEGEILLKMRLASICEEDLALLVNSSPVPGNHPRVLGHEGVGEVVSWRPCSDTSEQFDNLGAGDRLVFSPWSGSCAQCPCCKDNRFTSCPRAEKYGHHTLRDSSNGPVIPGGAFASHLVLRRGTQVSKIPEGLPDAMVAHLPCVLAPLIRVASAFKSLPNKKIAVIQGASLRGAYACALLRESGFEQVYCLDIDVEALKHIGRFGGIPVQETRYLSTGIVANRIPRPGPCKADLVLRLCHSGSTSSSSPVSVALELLRHGGTLILAGGSCTSPIVSSADVKNSTLDLQCWDKVAQKEITVKGICGYGQSDISSAVSFVHTTLTSYPYEVLLGPLQTSLYEFPSALAVAMSNRHSRVPIVTS